MQTTTDRSQTFDCPKCKDTGWILTLDENGYEVAAPCECYLEAIKKQRIKTLGLPERLRDKRLKTISASVYSPEAKKNFLNSCKSIKFYLDNIAEMMESGKGLYLYSQSKGSGKTNMAACIGNELIDKEIGCMFKTSIAILDEIKDSWSKEDYAERKVLDWFFTIPVLIIDDFGAENKTNWATERFYQIINERYSNGRPVIFTSNMSLNNTEYDSRITDRIKEMCFVIDFPEESVRERISAEQRTYMIAKETERK